MNWVCECLREEVVHDVAVDDAVEEVLSDEAVGTVDGVERALGECPGVGFEVKGGLVRVVQVGDRHW